MGQFSHLDRQELEKHTLFWVKIFIFQKVENLKFQVNFQITQVYKKKMTINMMD